MEIRSARQTHASFHEQHRVAHVAARHSTVDQPAWLRVWMRHSESMNADELAF